MIFGKTFLEDFAKRAGHETNNPPRGRRRLLHARTHKNRRVSAEASTEAVFWVQVLASSRHRVPAKNPRVPSFWGSVGWGGSHVGAREVHS